MTKTPKICIKTRYNITIHNSIVFSKVNNINNYTKRNITLRVFKTRKICFVLIPERYISIFILYLQKNDILLKIKNVTKRPI